MPDRYEIRGERKMRGEEGKVRWTKGPRREEALRHYLAQIRKEKSSLPLCSLSLSHSYSAISSTRIVFSATHYYSYTRTFFSLPYSVLSPTHCDSRIRSPLPPSLSPSPSLITAIDERYSVLSPTHCESRTAFSLPPVAIVNKNFVFIFILVIWWIFNNFNNILSTIKVCVMNAVRTFLSLNLILLIFRIKTIWN